MRRAIINPAPEAAAAMLVDTLGFLAADPERLGRFLALTGVAPQDIRARIDERSFQVAVFEHLAGDETLLKSFADETGRHPGEVTRMLANLGQRPWERETA